MTTAPLIETVNLHVWPKCNLHCTYCYGTFPARPGTLPLSDWQLILGELRHAGVTRVTFSGGEPTLHPDILGMLHHARALGLQTSIVTNGARLSDEMLRALDVVGLSLDADDDEVLARLGRRRPGDASYVEHTRRVVARAHEHRCRVKINTVVTAVNAQVSMARELVALRPYKWKALQFTRVAGENDAHADELAVPDETFRRFVERHADVAAAGIWVEPEPASVIRSTYVMVDPLGRVFQHAPDGGHRVSRSVLEVGVAAAVNEAGGYNRGAFVRRGGHVDVSRLTRGKATRPALIGLCGRSGAGKDVVASHLADRHGFRRLAFADHLKRVTQLAFGMTDEQLWGDGRNDLDPRWGATPRRVYQQLGDALRGIHPDALMRSCSDAARSALDAGEAVVIADVRMPDEVRAVRALGGRLWRIVRPDGGLSGEAAAHATETALDGIEVDAVLANDHGLDDLRQAVDTLLRAESARARKAGAS